MMLGLALSLALAYAPTRDPGTMLDEAGEARVAVLGKQLRCAVCQGVAISDSPASMAQAQLAKVRELVKEGKTDEEIREYFVGRYGEWVLLKPTTNGLNAFLWVAPVGLLVLGLIVIVATSKKRAPGPSTPLGMNGVAPVSARKSEDEDPFLAQVRADLEK